MYCRWIPKNLPCPRNFLVAPSHYIKQVEKNKEEQVYVCLTRVLFFLKKSSLKLEQKTCLSSRTWQLTVPEEDWEREEVPQTNVITLYLYVQQHSPPEM